jgi:hypothetical protein
MNRKEDQDGALNSTADLQRRRQLLGELALIWVSVPLMSACGAGGAASPAPAPAPSPTLAPAPSPAPAPAPATDDWSLRSSASGVVLANRLETQAERDVWVLTDGLEAHVTFDTAIKVPGALGSFKFAVLNTDGASSGNIGVPLPRTFGLGNTVWWSLRVRAPIEMAYQPFPTTTSAGTKVSILSYHARSHTGNEVVTSINYNRGLFNSTHDDGSQSTGADLYSITACSNTDFKWQPEIDRGASPLVGNDPDTGAPWSACAQDRARYGGLYSSNVGTSSKVGFGDPLTGGVRQYPNEWMTVTCRLVIGPTGWSTPTHRLTMWIAREGQPYVRINDQKNISMNADVDYDTLWLLPYYTGRTPGGRKITARTSNISGVTLSVCGLSTTIGDGTLEYVASTKLFRWRGAGEAYGTARGFSSANGILTINVESAKTDSYLVLTIAEASLPSSGTITDTVTIADGRPDTYVNYNDVIVSTQPINAPGQFPPT